VCLLCDRDLERNGVEVEFFGERTTLPAGPATLALRTGAPILPVGVAGTDRFWPRGRKLWGVGGAISLRVGDPFALERETRPDGTRESLEDVTTRLMVRIAALLPERHRGVYAPLLERPSDPAFGPNER